MASAGPSARGVAALVLARVERDGAFAAAALDAEVDRAAQLDPRDRALATELVYGTLRVLPWLEAKIARYLSRPLAKMDRATRVQLLLAAYQLFFLTRVPAFAAVNEAVTEVRRSRGKELGAFANAVLRKLAAEAKESPADVARAAAESAPAWLKSSLARTLGEEGASRYLTSALEPPPIGLRVQNAHDRDAWVERLRAAAPEATFEPGPVSPHAILARGAGRAHDLPGFAEAAWSIQEEGSQLVGLALGAREGERVLDACAGRGNKSAILAAAVGSSGALDVADLHASKLDRLGVELGRLGLSARASFAVDWSVGPGDAGDAYDAALVDAPCSGTGTLRRRPDLALRLSAEGVRALQELQIAIVARVATRLRPGGRLVFATCSALADEGEDVVAAVRARLPWLEPAPFSSEAAARVAGERHELRLLPYVHGTDAYYLASFIASSGRAS